MGSKPQLSERYPTTPIHKVDGPTDISFRRVDPVTGERFMDCPFCGYDEIAVSWSDKNDEDKYSWFMVCPMCNTKGPTVSSKKYGNGNQDQLIAAFRLWQDRNNRNAPT